MQGEDFEPFEFPDVHCFLTDFNTHSVEILVFVYLKQDPAKGFLVGSRFIGAYINFTNQLFQQIQKINSNATNN